MQTLPAKTPPPNDTVSQFRNAFELIVRWFFKLLNSSFEYLFYIISHKTHTIQRKCWAHPAAMFTHLERVWKKTHPAAVDKNEKAYNLKQLIIRRGIYYVCTRIRWLIFGIGFAPNHVRIKSPLRSLSRCAGRTLLIVKVTVLRSYWRIHIKIEYDVKNCNVLRFRCNLNFGNICLFVGVIDRWKVGFDLRCAKCFNRFFFQI